MTHMTKNIYKLVKIISSVVGIEFNLCVYNKYNIQKNEKIGIHSDTQTSKPDSICQSPNTPVVSVTYCGEMNFMIHKNKAKKNNEGLFFTKLNKKNISVWEYQDDQQCKHSVSYDKIKNGVSRECFVFCKIEKFGYFNKHGVSEDKLIKK